MSSHPRVPHDVCMRVTTSEPREQPSSGSVLTTLDCTERSRATIPARTPTFAASAPVFTRRGAGGVEGVEGVGIGVGVGLGAGLGAGIS